MWRNKEDLLPEAGEVTLNCDVHYDWAGEYGLLVTIIGLLWCLTEAGFNYVKPVQPPSTHTLALAAGTAA